jgi:hypothetical protein
MTVAEYARAHGLPWSTAKARLSGRRSRAEYLRTKRMPRHATPPAVVQRIRALIAQDEKHEWIAFECGVSRPTVTHIANGSRHNNSWCDAQETT